MKLSRLHQVALAVAITLPALQASAAPVEANLFLGYLNYTLTSLDDAGGATPSLTPSIFSSVYLYATPNVGDYANSRYLERPGYHFDDSYVDDYLPSAATPMTGAVKGENSQNVFAMLTDSDLLNDTNRDVYSQVKIYAGYTLSAHTKLEITGYLSMWAQIDSGAVNSRYANSEGAWTLTANASFRPYISTEAGVVLQTNAMSSYTDLNFGSTAQYWAWNAGATQSFGASGASDLSAFNDLPAVNGPLGDYIRMEIVNNGDTDARFNLNSIAYTHAIISAVPESSTLALLGLGLVGIAAATRRRSA